MIIMSSTLVGQGEIRWTFTSLLSLTPTCQVKAEVDKLPLAPPVMEGLYFEVKPKRDEPSRPGSSEKPPLYITSNHRSCPSLSHLTSSTLCPRKLSAPSKRTAAWGEKVEEEGGEEEVRYKLILMGSLLVHHLTTMAMLPWVVAEISKSRPGEKNLGAGLRSGGQLDTSIHNQTVFLCVSASWVRCVSVLGEGVVWDPLTHTVLFECRPHQVTKLIHNSQEPSSFGCLVKGTLNCSCYVFQCQDSTKGSETISEGLCGFPCCSWSDNKVTTGCHQ